MAVAFRVPATSSVYNGFSVLMPTRPDDVIRMRSLPTYWLAVVRAEPTFPVLNVMLVAIVDVLLKVDSA